MSLILMGGEFWGGLHDATLEAVELQWSSGEVVLRIRMQPLRVIVASGVRRLGCDREIPWDMSASINAVRGPVATSDGEAVLEIEMQSGDLIRIEAATFNLRDGE